MFRVHINVLIYCICIIVLNVQLKLCIITIWQCGIPLLPPHPLPPPSTLCPSPSPPSPCLPPTPCPSPQGRGAWGSIINSRRLSITAQPEISCYVEACPRGSWVRDAACVCLTIGSARPDGATTARLAGPSRRVLSLYSTYYCHPSNSGSCNHSV